MQACQTQIALRAAHLVLNMEKLLTSCRFKNIVNILKPKHNFYIVYEEIFYVLSFIVKEFDRFDQILLLYCRFNF